MTQDEIIRMAQEAGFEIVDGELRLYFDGSKVLLKPNYMGTVTDGLKEFAALVAAHEREKLAEQEPLMITPGGGAFPFAVVGELEQAEQEPVAWILTEADGTMDFDCQPTVKPTQNDYDALREGETFTPLYAAPVRTKDLTDDEINELWLTHGQGQMMYIHEKFARAVIAADREKNKCQ